MNDIRNAPTQQPRLDSYGRPIDEPATLLDALDEATPELSTLQFSAFHLSDEQPTQLLEVPGRNATQTTQVPDAFNRRALLPDDVTLPMLTLGESTYVTVSGQSIRNNVPIEGEATYAPDDPANWPTQMLPTPGSTRPARW